MSTSRAAIVEFLKTEPGGLTAREVSVALRIPAYQAFGTLSKMAAYNMVTRVKRPGQYNAFRYFPKVQA